MRNTAYLKCYLLADLWAKIKNIIDFSKTCTSYDAVKANMLDIVLMCLGDKKT
jgi:hypothetical protein